MRLKYITIANFQKSEWTNFREIAKQGRWRLEPGEVACLVSKSGGQVLFVYAPYVAAENPKEEAGTQRQVLRSERLRLTDKSASWNPLMLANYAREVGLTLDGLQRFEQIYRKNWSQQR